MLISQASRDLLDLNRGRWDLLQAWLNKPENAQAATKVRAPIDVFYQNWKRVDDGVFSDSDEIQSACLDLDTAENYAVEQGYPKPALHGTCPHPEKLAFDQQAIKTAKDIENYCKEHPDSAMCRATTPKDEPGGVGANVCLRSVRLAGLPDFVCSDWFPYALGGVGLLMVSGVVYAAYKTAQVAAPFAPLALELYAPGAGATYRKIQDARQRVGQET